jgi:ribose transport system ATP-binding protein
VWKRFPGTQALRDVTLELERGEVHALLGGNGSGKSTLIRILAGVLPADCGVIELGGRDHDARRLSPERAYDIGLRFVHQDGAVFGALTVAENLAAARGFPRGRLGRIRWRELHRRACTLLER